MEDAWPQVQLVHLTTTPFSSLSKAQKDILDVEAQPFSKEGILRLTDAPKDPKTAHQHYLSWSVTKCAYLSFLRSIMADIMVMRTTNSSPIEPMAPPAFCVSDRLCVPDGLGIPCGLF